MKYTEYYLIGTWAIMAAFLLGCMIYSILLGVQKMLNVRENITLSTGRVIAHTREPNGSQLAIPTTGYYAMTNAEYIEYTYIVRPDLKGV